MVFSSGVFLLLFLPIAIAIYYNPVVKNREFRNNWLLIVSLFFYAWGEPRYILIMLFGIRCSELGSGETDGSLQEGEKQESITDCSAYIESGIVIHL